MMKHFKIFIGALLVVLFISSCDNSKNTFTLTTTIEGLSEGSKLYIQQRTDSGFIITDTAQFSSKAYVFKGEIEHPKLVYITSESYRGAIPVFLESSKIVVSAHLDSLAKAKVNGSKSHDFYASTNTKLTEFDKVWQDFYYGEYRNMSIIEKEQNEVVVNMLYDSAQNLKANYLQDFLLKNGKEFATPLLALDNIDAMQVDAVQAIYDNLDPKLLETNDAKNFAKRLTIVKRTAVGQPFIDFTMNDTLGNAISLSEYANGKYVLVDFWAAWCGPCRRENPNVVANFEKFNDKGFTVFGVSFDKNREDWIKAIKTDKLFWGQVSDLQGWGNAAGKLYGIQSIPQNILLDPNGIIIEKNLRGPALGKKLEELLSN